MPHNRGSAEYDAYASSGVKLAAPNRRRPHGSPRVAPERASAGAGSSQEGDDASLLRQPAQPTAPMAQPGGKAAASPTASASLSRTIARVSKQAVDAVFTILPRPRTAAAAAPGSMATESQPEAGAPAAHAAASGASSGASRGGPPASSRVPPLPLQQQQQLGSPAALSPKGPAAAAAVAAMSPRGAGARSTPRPSDALSPRATPRLPAGLALSPRLTPRPAAAAVQSEQPTDVYEALKRQQPVAVQQQIELEEVFWDAQELQERRKDLQQRLRDEEMLERIKRRVAGEKINLPSVAMPKVLTKLLTPRGGGSGSSTPRSPGSARSAGGERSLPETARSDGGRPNLLGGPFADLAQVAAGDSNATPQRGSSVQPSSYGGPSGRSSYAVTGPRNSLGGRNSYAARNSLGARTSLGNGRPSHAMRQSWIDFYHANRQQPAVPAWRRKLQRRVQAVVQHPDFGLAVTLLIALNCVSLALYQPQLPDDEGRNRDLKSLEMAINFAFTVEVILTCIAAGGIKEYLRSPWNLFDLSMVLVGYTDFIPSGGGEQTGGVRALRALRALRPLRTITRFDSLRSIVVCFLEAVPLLLSVVQLLVFFIVLFAITGTLLFMDSFHVGCFNQVTGAREFYGEMDDFGCGARECPANYTCKAYEPEEPFNSAGFGNVGESMLTSFQVITMSSWAYIMYIVMDSTGIAAFLFFVAIVLLQAYFVINLFLAVLKNKFAKAQELYSKVATDEGKQRSTFVVLWRRLQERWQRTSARRRELDAMRMTERSTRGTTGFSTPTSIRTGAEEMQRRRPSLRIPQTRWQWGLYYANSYWFELRWHVRQVVEHPMFDYLFLSCIVANTVLLAMTTADMSPAYAKAIEDGSRVLTVVFICEAAVKLVGLGIWGYMADPFNNFDFVIAVLGLVELIIAMGSSGTALRSFRTLRILRSLRVLRVLKVFRYLQSLRVITDVLLSSIGAFLAIASLMTLFIFVFAIVGLQTFGHYDLEPQFPNFHNVWHAIILVFQTLTLENWGQLMFSVQAAAGWASTLYFVVWVALGKWTLLTLFLAITLSAFEANYEKYNTRGGTAGGVGRLVGCFRSVKDFLLRPFKRRKRPRRVAPTLSFNSSTSLGSVTSVDPTPPNGFAPPPGQGRFKRSPTGFVRGFAALSPASTEEEEEEEQGGTGVAAGAQKGQLGDAAGGGAAKSAALPSKLGRSPADVLLALGGGTDDQEAQEEAQRIKAGVEGPAAAAGTPRRSPADLLLMVGEGTEEAEAPSAPPLPAKPRPSPAPASVVLTLGGGTEDSEAPPSDAPPSDAPPSQQRPAPKAVAAGGAAAATHGGPLAGSAVRRAMAQGSPGLRSKGLIPAVHVGAAQGGGHANGSKKQQQEEQLGQQSGDEVAAVPSPVLAAPSPATQQAAGPAVAKGHVSHMVEKFEVAFSPEAQRQLRRASSAPLTAPRVAFAPGSSPGAGRAGSDDEGSGGDDEDDAASVKSEGDAGLGEQVACEAGGVGGGSGGAPFARKRAKSRHARFAVPDDSSEEDSPPLRPPRDTPPPTAASPASASGGAARQTRRSLTPHHRVGKPLGLVGALKRSGSGEAPASGQSTPTSDSESDASSLGRPGRGRGIFGGGRFGGGSFNRRNRSHSDSTVPSDLLEEAERESELSGSLTSSGPTLGASGRLNRMGTLSRMATRVRKRSKRKDFPELAGRSLFCFEADSPVRGFIYSLVTLQYFDYAMMLVVLLSCIQMAMETPTMDPAATRTILLKWIDIGTTIVFWVEALLKIVAFSFKAYISYFTNKVDFGVVVMSTVVLIAESIDAKFLKALRVLRAIKPLRVLTRSVSMLLVFHTLTRSLMEMGNVTVLCALCFLIFAILGVQLFAGLFWSCTDPAVKGKAECVGSFLDPATDQLVPREWVNLHYNFDDIGNAFLTLFITATLDGYTPAMYMSMSTRTDPGLQPYMGANSAAFLFWFAYITLVAFFVLNLYVGVVFYQFQRLKMLSQTGSAVLTASQTGYVEMMKAVFRLKPLDKAPLPPNPVRRLCHRLAYHPWFDNAMTAVIVANILLLATTYYGEPASFAAAKEYANTAFSAIVILECLVKGVAMGPRLYWRSSWNKFDLALSVAAIVDIITQILNAVLGSVVDLSTIKKTMMLLRTLRMFKLMRKFKGIQALMTTLIISLPAIFNVGALLLLFFFIYSYMGVLLLGNIKLQRHLNPHANFQTFPNAMLLLFRVATGDDWAGIMQDCMVKPPDCDPDAGECGSKFVWVYFLTFYLAVGLIAFNLFTTVILETFERIQDTELWRITPANLDEFCELWAEYDDGTSLIEPKDLEQILMRMPPPMGLGAKANGTDVVRFVFALDIPLVDGKVPFYRTAFELVKKGAQAEIPPGELKRKLDRMIRRFLNKHSPESVDEHMSFSVACTVVRIQRHWRGLVAKRKEAAAKEAARAARRAAGLPSEEEPPPVEEAPPPPEPTTKFHAVVRRASVVLASIRHSVKRGSKAAGGASAGLAAVQEGGLRPSLPAAGGGGDGSGPPRQSHASLAAPPPPPPQLKGVRHSGAVVGQLPQEAAAAGPLSQGRPTS